MHEGMGPILCLHMSLYRFIPLYKGHRNVMKMKSKLNSTRIRAGIILTDSSH